MAINIKLTYKRILLKLSGEVLQGSRGFGIEAKVLERITQEIKELIDLSVQIGIVVGGGNFFRGATLVNMGINRVVGDHIGMLATIMNGLAIRDSLHRMHISAHLMSAIPLNSICDSYNWSKAINLLCDNHVVIFSAGTGNPFFTTDSAACLRGIEIGADAILKATKVDGVFAIDPEKDPSSIMYDKISYNEVLEKKLKIMDLTAFTLARDYKLPICIFNINKSGALRRVIMGEKEGTLIMK